LCDEDFYSVKIDPTVFEDFGPARVDTGLVDSWGHPITKPNPRQKDRIGFVIPSITSVVKRF
jgi:hypothetical protein